ncbi:hypothetical protein AB0J42_36090 [Nonomuraea sp. NPDC049649]|uniref:hypothetical protein n=1 Tax=Nonomuraea sp. NPDC049649 TaxID=3155776 RepID=UPI00342876AC
MQLMATGRRPPYSGIAEVLSKAANPICGEDLLKPLPTGLQQPFLRQGEKGAVLDGFVILGRRADQDGEDPASSLKLLGPRRMDHALDGLPCRPYGKAHQRIEENTAPLGLPGLQDDRRHELRNLVQGFRKFFDGLGHGNEKIAPEMIGELPSGLSRFAPAEPLIELLDYGTSKDVSDFLDPVDGVRVFG